MKNVPYERLKENIQGFVRLSKTKPELFRFLAAMIFANMAPCSKKTYSRIYDESYRRLAKYGMKLPKKEIDKHLAEFAAERRKKCA